MVLRFAGIWLLLVSSGGPTADKPTVVFAPPADADRVSHAMTLRVANCQAAYQALRSRGATFLTPPHDWGAQIRCFLRDPDGHLIEISQSTRTWQRQMRMRLPQSAHWGSFGRRSVQRLCTAVRFQRHGHLGGPSGFSCQPLLSPRNRH